MNESMKELLAILATAVNEGRTVSIKAEEITFTAGSDGAIEGGATTLEITVES
jgi:hypothetical protein